MGNHFKKPEPIHDDLLEDCDPMIVRVRVPLGLSPGLRILYDLLGPAIASLDTSIVSRMIKADLNFDHWNDKQFLTIYHLINSIKNHVHEDPDKVGETVYEMTYLLIHSTEGRVLIEKFNINKTYFHDLDGQLVIYPFKSQYMNFGEWLRLCYQNVYHQHRFARFYRICLNRIMSAVVSYLVNVN